MDVKENVNSAHKRKLGMLGESEVCSFLMDNGHTVIERNCRQGHLEIDIISVDRKGMHFVEVKSRKVPYSAAPQENVTLKKQKRIAEAAARYLKRSKDPRLSPDMEVNFDVAAVTFGKDGKFSIEWFPNAYYPMFV